MKEIGFWDYTCPGHGSLEYYTREDWDRLLDDMAAGGFNSLVLGIKWITTGYRSRYPWLDQNPEVAAIASDNATLCYALQGARKRGLRTWLLVVGSYFIIKNFGIPPAPRASSWVGSSSYDLDQPGVGERIVALFEEVTDLFGALADGIVVELEFCDGEAPHRVPLYNQWAAANGRPEFAAIKDIYLQPRSFPFTHWRDFTTSRRILMMQRIERAIRGRGFGGQLSSIAELENSEMALIGNINLRMLYEALPEWALVTYDSIYDRRVNRLASMDFCIEQPREIGFEVQYLTRGVMTFMGRGDKSVDDLPRQWRMSMEDAATHKPDVLWFMGSDARSDGHVCSNVKLPAWGISDGRTGRLKLMEMAKEMGLCKTERR